MLNNKRGSVWIVVFVFLILFLTGFTLIRFVTSNAPIYEGIEDARFLQNSLAVEEEVNFVFGQVVDSAYYGAYEETINSGVNGKSGQFLLNDFRSKFNDGMKEEIGRYSFEEEYMNQIKIKVLAGEYDTELDKDKLVAVIKNVVFEDENEGVKVIYTFDVKHEKFFEPDFEDLISVYSDCRNSDEIKTCYESRVEDYDIEVNDADGKNVVILNSEKKYLVGSEFREISLRIEY